MNDTVYYFFISIKVKTKSYVRSNGDEAVSNRQCQNSYKKFIGGDFLLTDKQRSGRAIEIGDSEIKEIIDTAQYSTTRDITEKLRVPHIRFENVSNKWVT